MGTQQILLIVLGVIVVGVAVVVGINIFGSNAEQSNKDALTQSAIRIATSARSFYEKPTMLGGGSHSFTSISIRDCGVQETESGSGIAENADGTYRFGPPAENTIAVFGMSVIDPKMMVRVAIDMTATTDEDRMTVAFRGWSGSLKVATTTTVDSP